MSPPLDGEWKVRRTGGLPPPMLGVRTRIERPRRETTISLVLVALDRSANQDRARLRLWAVGLR